MIKKSEMSDVDFTLPKTILDLMSPSASSPPCTPSTEPLGKKGLTPKASTPKKGSTKKKGSIKKNDGNPPKESSLASHDTRASGLRSLMSHTVSSQAKDLISPNVSSQRRNSANTLAEQEDLFSSKLSAGRRASEDMPELESQSPKHETRQLASKNLPGKFRRRESLAKLQGETSLAPERASISSLEEVLPPLERGSIGSAEPSRIILSVEPSLTLSVELDKLAKSERTAKLIVDEIVSTEVTYVRGLQTLTEAFLIPVQESGLGSSAMSSLLSSAKTIHQLHVSFLNDLQGKSVPEVLPVFKSYLNFMRAYFSFVQNFPIALAEFASNTKLHTLIDNLGKKSGTSGVSEFLILPIQRVPRYVLFLEALKKETASEAYREQLMEVIQQTRDLADEINSCLAQVEMTDKLFKLQNLVSSIPDDWMVLDQTNVFIAEALMVRILDLPKEDDNFPEAHPFKDKRSETVRVILFNTCVLITTYNYKYRQRIDLQTLVVYPKFELMMMITTELNGGTTIDSVTTLMCSGEQVRDQWIEQFRANAIIAQESAARDVKQGRYQRCENTVNVFLRIRPFVTQEEKDLGERCLKVDGDVVTLEQAKSHHRADRVAHFDTVFDVGATQAEIFERVGAEALGGIFMGYNVAILCYGNTGAGKTHTMFGDVAVEENKGLIPRILEELFKVCNEKDEKGHDVYTKKEVAVSFLQVYNEEVQDLQGVRDAHGQLASLEIKRILTKKTGQNYQVVGLKSTIVTSAQQAMQIVFDGNENRSTRSHKMNDMSSRSHAVLTLTIELLRTSTNKRMFCVSSFIDLAGSEEAQRTGATGKALEESVYINKSLITLQRVVNALVENRRRTKGKQVPVPYRESKLTQLLGDVIHVKEHLLSLILNASSSPASGQNHMTAKTMVFGQGLKQLAIDKSALHANIITPKAQADPKKNPFNFLTGVWKSVEKDERNLR